MPRKGSPHKGKKQSGRPVFDSIRKPTAPPGHALSRAKPDDIARPAMRKANTSGHLTLQATNNHER